ncbi:acyl-CoA thioesterase [Pseudonocardia kunmingensis]|uniref:Acyl-CoA thioesterase-2 n=1 Tax=Pseudonocardia kunmingensis TaxID=630975 RepID=A0A543CYD6_9PSEU|nr:acyl-CoA thioesterase II [Pseudonocardia kunmingensis]TQM02114.1 acyl-CoA thioesterase-2 [Pseudonocardia kunmingensis]
MTSSTADAPPVTFAALLALEQEEPETFRAPGHGGPPERTFGGTLVAQALLAAGRTVAPERSAHSLHAYFLRPGDASAPTDYRVTAIRDGATYATRQVVAAQHGKPTFLLTASFQLPEDGREHQLPRLDAPPPEQLPTLQEASAGLGGALGRWFARLPLTRPLDLRFDGELPRVAAARGEAAAPRHRFWLRTREHLPDAQLPHSCVVAYVSDMLLLSTSLAPHATTSGAPDVAAASIDHAVWFHRPFRADEWLFYEQESSSAFGGRALCHGRLFTRSGDLVATVAQEAMIRDRAAPADSPTARN